MSVGQVRSFYLFFFTFYFPCHEGNHHVPYLDQDSNYLVFSEHSDQDHDHDDDDDDDHNHDDHDDDDHDNDNQDAHNYLGIDGLHPGRERGGRGERGKPEHIQRIRSFQGICQRSVMGVQGTKNFIIRNSNMFHGTGVFNFFEYFLLVGSLKRKSEILQ